MHSWLPSKAVRRREAELQACAQPLERNSQASVPSHDAEVFSRTAIFPPRHTAYCSVTDLEYINQF